MNIHEHDDYEKLVKLFYPSLEASGNIYYGQTRKLTMDEILGKNDMGFESHIESEKQGTDYSKFFNWKIGPLHGSVRVGDLETFPLAYAKYKLVITNRTVENHLNSASFPTYENEIACIFDSIAYTTGNPVDESESWDGRHFYVDDNCTNKYLYIALVDYYSNEEFSDPLHTPLCITNIGDSAGRFQLDNNNVNNAHYLISYGDGKWHTLELNTEIPVDPHTSVYIKGHRDSQLGSSHLSFITSFDCTISGNINSLLDEYRYSEIDDLSANKTPSGYDIGNYTFYELFKNARTIVDVSRLQLPSHTLCNGCYYGMFRGCTEITISPNLVAEDGILNCYAYMFYGCTKLSHVRCNTNLVDNYEASSNWLFDVSQNGLILADSNKVDYNFYPSDWVNLPYDESSIPITIANFGGPTYIRLVKSKYYNLLEDNEYQYYDVDNNSWEDLELSVYDESTEQYTYGTAVYINTGYYTQVRCKSHNVNQTGDVFNEVPGSYVYFKVQSPNSYDSSDSTVYDDPQLHIAGNVNSMLISSDYNHLTDISEYSFAFEYLFDSLQYVKNIPKLYNDTLSEWCYLGMFNNCYATSSPDLLAAHLATGCYAFMFNNSNIIIAPYIHTSELASYCCYNMFNECSDLLCTYRLPDTALHEGCYNSMFKQCISLTSVQPLIYSSISAIGCFEEMFYSCEKLQSIKWLASDFVASEVADNMLYGVAIRLDPFRFYCNSREWDVNSLEIIGMNSLYEWNIIDLYEKIKEGETDEEKTSVYRSQYMITSGSDSDQNGKGKLDGDGNYESSFDENGNHPMGSYNTDGSYNQEIWGYKSFNSPVQFRNGIYCGNIYDYNFSVSSYSFDLAGTAEFKGVSISTNGVSAAETGTKSSIALGYTGLMGANSESEIYITADTIYIGRTPTEYYVTISNSDITVFSSVYPSNTNEYDLGSTIYRWNTAYINSVDITGNILPYYNSNTNQLSEVNIGSDDKKIKNIYADNFHGVITHPDESFYYDHGDKTEVLPLVGQIFIAKLYGEWGSTPILRPGDGIYTSGEEFKSGLYYFKQIAANGNTNYFRKFNMSSLDGTQDWLDITYNSVAYYRILSYAINSINEHKSMLVIRVS